MAFFFEDNRRGKTILRLCWDDATKGQGKAGRRRVNVLGSDHTDAMDAAQLSPKERAALALGATNKKLRAQLLRCYESLENLRKQEAAAAGGFGQGPRYDSGVVELLDARIVQVKDEAKIRVARGGRAGKSPSTAREYEATVRKFKAFLQLGGRSGLKTGDLDVEALRAFFRWLSTKPMDKAGAKKPMAPASVNKHRRILKALLGHFLDEGQRRPYFRLTAKAFRTAFRAQAEEVDAPERYEPVELVGFLEAAAALDARGKKPLTRTRRGKVESYEKGHNYSPVMPWAIVLMMTGCRRHVAAGLRWDDVNLGDGALTFRPSKTGRARLCPLVDASTRVSPLTLEILRAWRKADPEAEYVLPCRSRGKAKRHPVFPKLPWKEAAEASETTIHPQGLRSNWVSYMAALGRPLSTIALMAGHGPLVLERHYLSFARQHLAGESLDDAMGVKLALGQALAAAQESNSARS